MPPPPPPEAPGPGRKKLLVLVTVAVVIVAALAAVAVLLLSGGQNQPPPQEATLDHVVTSPSTLAIDQSEFATLSAKAYDTKTFEQTANATFAWTVSPTGAVRFVSPANQATVQVKANLSGSATITATATWKSLSKSGTVSATFGAVHFVVTSDKNDPLLGEPVTLTVAATRADSTSARNYTGTVAFTSTDPQATLPTGAGNTFVAGNFGTKSFSNVVVRQSGNVQITVADNEATSITGSITLFGNRAPVARMAITPDPADPMAMSVDGRTSSDPDTGDSITVYAWDFGDGNTATGSTASHTYAQPGTYPVLLGVTDSHGASNATSGSFRAKAPPVSNFEVLQMNASGVDIYVRVNATGSNDPDGTITSYNYTWGDGSYTNSTANETYHVYAASYNGQDVTMSLRVTDNDNLATTFSRLVTISLVLLPPTATFDFSPPIDQATRTVYVDASQSRSPQGRPIIYYNWTWGDGKWDNVTVPTFSHRYASDGVYTVNLTVGDSLNLKGYAERIANIQQPALPPNVYFNVTRTLMRVDVDANATWDPNNNIATYNWGWGDGPTSWTNGTLPYARHTYATPGRYTITLVVKDSTSPTPLENSTTHKVSVATSTLDYTYYDFFDVPYGEWWDYRAWNSIYDDRPINANCFNQSSLTDPYGRTTICQPANPALKDYETYPYTDWYPLPGNTNWDNPGNNPLIYAPYRFRAVGVNVPGYNLSEPVFLPVLNYGQPAGSQLDFDWRMQYLDYPTAAYLSNVTGTNPNACPGVTPDSNDGFKIRSIITLTMDLQESRRIFGVVGGTVAQARTWWASNTNARCDTKGAAETALDSWFITLGGSQNVVGKYDIYNSFEWYYTPFYTQMTATVDADGTTHVSIDHAAWGTEVLLARMFYWGNVSYAQNYLDSTKAAGWWGMELAWMEDLQFSGSLHTAPAGFDFAMTTVLQYHFQLLTLPGSDGYLNRVGDIPYWTWGPILTDYTNDATPKHLLSELDRYPTQTYVHSTPGSNRYNVTLPYDYAPISWNLQAGQTWHFQFPTGNVMFYDPNLTPTPANPLGAYVEVKAPLTYRSQKPANFGDWDANARTWDVYGPAITGGPSGAPGSYALEPWGAITFVDPPVGGTALVASSRMSGPSSPTSGALSAPTILPPSAAMFTPQAADRFVPVVAVAPSRSGF